MDTMNLHDILLKWFQTFELKSPHKKIPDLSDGVALAEALNQIAPEWFTDEWVSTKIKTGTIGQWRLRVSNLKKILEKVVDYYQECFGQNLSGFDKPDLMAIGERSDPVETGRLLQLILGCAVNCENKQEYITRIVAMDELEQRAMMECIQELDGGGALSFSASLSIEPQLEQLASQLNAATLARDQMSQRCMDLEMQVNMLQEEKAALVEEKRKLSEQVESTLEAAVAGGGATRRQAEALKEALFKAETSRDDYRMRLEAQDKELTELRLKVEELQRAGQEARRLKDEVDALRETADRAEKYEAALESCRKKLEEAGDVRRELRLLEAKHSACSSSTAELEGELRRLAAYKPQLEVYKKECAELGAKLGEEVKRSERLEREAREAGDALEALRQERERLVKERDSLREANEELHCLQLSGAHTRASEHALSHASARVAQLEATLLEVQQNAAREKQRAATAAEEREAEARQFASLMQAKLTSKELELQELEEKHRRYVDKARSVVRAMDPSVADDTPLELSLLRNQLSESQKELKEVQRELEESKRLKETEDGLVATAFYNLGQVKARDSAEQRLASLGVGGSFMARQRQPAARKLPAFSSK